MVIPALRRCSCRIGSKLAAARALSPETATSSLGTILDLSKVDEDELYTALDWLG